MSANPLHSCIIAKQFPCVFNLSLWFVASVEAGPWGCEGRLCSDLHEVFKQTLEVKNRLLTLQTIELSTG